MTAPRANSVAIAQHPSARVVDRCEATVLETRDGRCTLLAVDGESLAVPSGKAGRFLVRVDDLVMADVMDDGTARIAYVVSSAEDEFIPHVSTLGDLARLVLPEHIVHLLAEVGDSTLEIGQAGIDVKGPRVSVSSNTQLNLQGRNVRTDAEDLCVLQGREIHLN